MNTYVIFHADADLSPFYIRAETAAKAKYKNFLDWSEAFQRYDFKAYLRGIQSCTKIAKDGERHDVSNIR